MTEKDSDNEESEVLCVKQTIEANGLTTEKEVLIPVDESKTADRLTMVYEGLKVILVDES